jgi:hypothetical protein
MPISLKRTRDVGDTRGLSNQAGRASCRHKSFIRRAIGSSNAFSFHVRLSRRATQSLNKVTTIVLR